MNKIFRQDNPFRRNAVTKPKPPPFDNRKNRRQFVAVLRLPLLTTVPTSKPTTFRGYERGKKVSITISAKRTDIGRATVLDAHILTYVASKATQTYNNILVPGMFVEIEPYVMLDELGMPADAQAQARVVEGLRRLHVTRVTITNWGDKSISATERLLHIERRPGTDTYLVSVPAWLQDEIEVGRVVTIPGDAMMLDGMRARLFGWAKGWVGRKVDDARFITQREALARLGPMPTGTNPWSAILDAVAANDVPGYDLRLEVYKDLPAIAVRERVELSSETIIDVEPSERSQPKEIFLEYDDDTPLPTAEQRERWFDLMRPEPSPPIREIEI